MEKTMSPKTLKKTFGLEIGKSYSLTNGDVVTLKAVVRRAYDRALLALAECNGRSCDFTINDTARWVAR